MSTGMEENTPLKIDSPQYIHNTYIIPIQNARRKYHLRIPF